MLVQRDIEKHRNQHKLTSMLYWIKCGYSGIQSLDNLKSTNKKSKQDQNKIDEITEFRKIISISAPCTATPLDEPTSVTSDANADCERSKTERPLSSS
jgi:hypothetical protein